MEPLYVGLVALSIIVITLLLSKRNITKEKARSEVLETELFYSHDKTLELQKKLIREEREIRSEVEQRASIQYKQLLQASKLVTLGTLASGMAHEINNPNNFIALNNAVMKKILPDLLPLLKEELQQNPDAEMASLPLSLVIEKLPQLCTAVDEGTQRISKIVKQLKDFSREEPEGLKDGIDIAEIIYTAQRLLQHKISKRCHNFTLDMGLDIPKVRGHAQRLEQVLINLIDNALDALQTPDAAIHLSLTHDVTQSLLRIIICDEGQGIAEVDRERIFDPFFTTKREKGGTGLGLSISFSIVEEHAGTLYFEPTDTGGTRALLELPLSR